MRISDLSSDVCSSDLLLNAFSYALIPSQASQGDNVLSQPEQVAWRNRLLNLALTSETQAIVAFGVQARRAVDLWPGKGDTPVFEVPHPSSRDEGVLLERWRDAIEQLRALVMPDDDGDPGLPNYGSSFRESDYARSEEHTSELQARMRTSNAVFCLKKKQVLKIKHINNTCTARSQ